MPNKKKAKRIRNCSIIAVLALAVTVGTAWMLKQPASTISGSLICGQEEHTHSAECYQSKLSCGLEESDIHTHTDQCWVQELACAKNEHIHSDACYDTTDAQPDPPEQQLPEQQAPQPPQSENKQPQTVPEMMWQNVPADYTDVRTATLPNGSTVYLFSQPGVISEQVQLLAKQIDTSDSLFAQAQERVQASGVLYDYFTALDISLIDENGTEVEPTAPVYVSIDGGTLLPQETNPQSIRIQHHKELSQYDSMSSNTYGPQVEVETVVDEQKGVLSQNDYTGSWVATFPVDSFSVYTITSAGWTNLKINIQCVDEETKELVANHKPTDIHYTDAYKPSAVFDVVLGQPITGYTYDNKAYYMEGTDYKYIIYGLRREGGKWYYYSDERKSNKKEFSPKFEVPSQDKDPEGYIRVVYKKIMNIPVLYMDDAGSSTQKETRIPASEAPNQKNPDLFVYNGTTLDISNADVMPKCNNYFFTGKAYVDDPKPENEVRKVVREGGVAQAITTKGRKVALPNPPQNDNQRLKLLYHKVQSGGKPERIKTISTKEKGGMIINLFDYNSGSTSQDHEPINAGRTLQFVGDMKRPDDYNVWTGKDGGIYKGLVKEDLDPKGYPVLFNGESLDYLFDPDKCIAEFNKNPNGMIKHVHTNLDNLFWRDKNGYYHYDSMTNFATIMDPDVDGGGHTPDHKDGGDFAVYKQPALPGLQATGDNPKFLPFNTYEEANIPKVDGQAEPNKEYHFGMTIETPFNMPPNGMISDGQGGFNDMVFKFNGDDDVWVFVDNKLVLDLGGIHDRYGGTINFKTGEVTTNAPATPHSGQKQKNMYGIDPTGMSDEKLAQIREQKGFGKFTTHNIKFFYLERGKGASNCAITFNLLPVEHGLIVGKRVPEELHDAATDHMWYQFQAEVEYNNNKQKLPLANAKYAIFKWDPDETDHVNGAKPAGSGITDENGRFWLRPGQRADFSGAVDLKYANVENSTKIYVSEVFSDTEPIPNVTAWTGNSYTEGSYLEVKDGTGKTRKLSPALYDSNVNKFHTEQTRIKDIIEGPVQGGNNESMRQVVLQTGRKNQFNWVDFENDLGEVASLDIIKEVQPIMDKMFAIKVEFWDAKEKKWTSLPLGSEYWISGKDEEPTSGIKRELTEEANGLIFIEHNQKIHLDVLPGTKYRVSEVLVDEDKEIYTTTYVGEIVKGKVDDAENFADWEIYPDEQQQGKQGGIGNKYGIKPGSHHKITITNVANITLPPQLHIKKVVEGYAPEDMLFDIQIKVGKSENQLAPLPKDYPYTLTRNGVEEPYKVTTDNGVISIRAEDTINLTLEPGTVYSVEEINKNKNFQVEYQLKVSQIEWDMKDPSKPLENIPTNKNEIHNITVTNRGNAFIAPKGSFVLEKQVTGKNKPSANKKFPFDLSILDYVTDNTNGGYKLSVDCKATYYGTPAGERTELGNPVNGTLTTDISFVPQKVQGGYTPNRGEEYSAYLFLYPGESVVITGLPTGYSMYVRESLSSEDAADYDVSFTEKDTITHGNELTTKDKIHADNVLEVLCTNESKLQDNTALKITKIVKRTDQPDNLPTEDDKKEIFTFDLTLKEPASFNADAVRAEIKTEDGTTTSQTLVFKQHKKDYVTQFELKHGQTITITGLPVGIDVVVKETGHKGYAVSMNQKPGDTVTVHLRQNSGAPHTVECVNMAGVELPGTGGHGLWPYLFAGIVLIGTAGLLYYRKRKHGTM